MSSRLAAAVDQAATAFSSPRFELPPQPSPLQRFMHGLSMPKRALSAALAMPERRADYRRWVVPQLVLVAVGTFLITVGPLLSGALTSKPTPPERSSGSARVDEGRRRVIDGTELLLDAIASKVPMDEAGRKDLDRARDDLKRARQELMFSDGGLPPVDAGSPTVVDGGAVAGPDGGGSLHFGLDLAGIHLDWERDAATGATKPAPHPPTRRGEEADEVRELGDGWSLRGWAARSPLLAALGLLYATLLGLEQVVAVLGREHQDQFGRGVAESTGVAPDDPEKTPRVRLHLRWLLRKLTRRMRVFAVLGPGLLLASLLQLVPWVGDWLAAAAGVLWTAYWYALLTLSRSGAAWHPRELREPFFLRGFAFLTERVPGFRWFLPRLFLRFWRRTTAFFLPACASFEEAPFEALGLGAARLLLGLPLLYTAFRGVVPVAGAHVLAPGRVGLEAPLSEPLPQVEAAIDPG